MTVTISDPMPDLSGKRCLVLGAGGFIGSHLCDGLSAVGATVRAFGHPPRFAPARMPDDWIACDASDRDALGRAIAGADLVFHLLGSADPSASNQHPSRDLLQAIATDSAVVDLCVSHGVGRLIFVSSGGTVYGPARHLPIGEDHPTDPTSAYGIAKLATEKYLQLRHQLDGLDHVILRVANPYGPLQDPHRGQGVIPKLLYRAMRDEQIDIWGDGSAVRDYIYISDLVQALLQAATATLPHRIFNIGSGIGRSLTTILSMAETVLNHPVRRVYIPSASAIIQANVLDCSRAHDALGWNSVVDWSDGVVRTVAWIADQYDIPIDRR